MFFQVSPVLLEGLILTEREHFSGGLVEWPSSCPCSLRNPVTWSKKEVTSSWCHSTSFWPREQKVSWSGISAKDCNLEVKHTNSLLCVHSARVCTCGTAASYRLSSDIMKLPPYAPLERFQSQPDISTDPVYFCSFLFTYGNVCTEQWIRFQNETKQKKDKPLCLWRSISTFLPALILHLGKAYLLLYVKS